MPADAPTEDVIVTQPMLRDGGPLATLVLMQVCAYGETPPDVVEERARQLNPPGTSAGTWRIVWGDGPEDDWLNNPRTAPTPCSDFPDRIHYLLSC